jgi:hypothetical protein
MIDPITLACFVIWCAVWVTGALLVKQITGNGG